VIGLDDAGDRRAETVVLLHGAGLPRQMWQPQLAALSVRYRVVVPDLPGLVGGDGPPFTVSGAARAIADVIGVHVGRPVHLCGLSLGAMVATQMAISTPDVVRTLILSAGQVCPSRLLMVLQRLIVGILPESRLFSLPPAIRTNYPDIAAAARVQQVSVGKDGIRQVLREASHVDFRQSLREIRAPALVLCGARDRANVPAARALATGIRHAELRIVPEAGHLWNLEYPDSFASTVMEWVGRHDTPAREP
jgi:pimeloyl-ACP methyl ester carboxylesterase